MDSIRSGLRASLGDMCLAKGRCGMISEEATLGEILSQPLLSPVAADAIRGRKLSDTPLWKKSFRQIGQGLLGGDVRRGLTRLTEAARGGDWFYRIYDEEECAENPDRRSVHLVFLPAGSRRPGRPFILLVPGGGFVNVWNLTEGWPVAAQFNDLGYDVFILTYQVNGEADILEREMQDFARALRFIAANAKRFGVEADKYITCGFSAGGYLVCLWNVREKGFRAFDLPKPRAVFPVYPLTSWRLAAKRDPLDEALEMRLFGMSAEEAAKTPYEIPEHAGDFPPCALFLAAGDELVPAEHSKALDRALRKAGIPCRLEIGPEGGHGFADGTGMCMQGWIRRAVRWVEGLEK